MTSRGEMPFLDHLEELRWRILWSLLAIFVGTILGWFLLDKVDIIEVLKRPIAPYLPGGRLIFTSPAEPFMLTLKVAFALGCLVASPLVIYHIWAFLAPALYDRERRLIIPALAVGVVLFLAGGMACYQWLLPAALKVLIGFSRSDLTPMITIDRYFAMAVPFVVGCGLVAELPLVVTILAALGIVTPQFLGRQRRYAVVIAAFLAAILTPPDAVSMMLMLVPLLLLYEISIWCAYVASRRRARRMAAATLVLLFVGIGSLQAQNPPPAPPPPPAQRVVRDSGAVVKPPGPPIPGDTGRRGALDTATAHKQGLPTGPSRSFPPADAVMDSLLKLQGYQLTHYTADTLVVVGDSQTIYLKREAYVEREGTQLQADSIRYHEGTCRLDASGDPQLFDQGTVLIGEGMRYDTCRHRGTVRDALTDFQQGGVTWYVTGRAFANDSNSRRVYASKAAFTSDPQPVPDYHFAAGEVKWINKHTMVARPVVLYVRDVPIMWLPFLFNDIRGGRRSGILFPRFGVNDLVRPSRHYTRHISDFGYYFAVNDYLDVLVAGDWFSGRYIQFHGQAQYHVINRFMNGQLSYTRMQELDNPGVNTTIGWNHSQRFSSRSSFNANVLYATDGRLVQRNSTNPWEVVARMNSTLNFERRFAWGTLNIGGSRSQDLSSNNISQTFPTINLTPSSVNITPWMTWSPAFSFTNDMQFHQPAPSLLIPPPPADTAPDTLHLFNDVRRTSMTFSTPLRIGRWNWSNNIQVADGRTHGRTEYRLPDSTGALHSVVYAETFETRVDWQTGINLPSFFASTWKLQPGVAIVNATSAGPFMIRNQFTGGQFVQQGKRLQFSASVTPTFFGFFPGFGPFSRIRHSFSPQVSWQWAPAAAVDTAFAHALDPSGRTVNLHSDPQQTIQIQLSQNFEAKVKPAAGDTTGEQDARKVKLLSIQTSAIGYNFEAAKLPHRTGWQDAQLRNSFLSDLLPSFQLTITHDLWKGDVGTDSAKFDPFLSNVSASFTVTPATLQGIGRMFGLKPRQNQTARPDSTAPLDTISRQADNFRRYDQNTRVPYGARGTGAGMLGGGGRGFTLGISVSSSRSRTDTTPQLRNVPGRRTAALNMSFTPTRNWTANWSTQFDMATGQFTFHQLSFQRDLRRWRAMFSFSRTATGNFQFSFNITLSDQPDIKFDYDQSTYVR